MSKKVPSAVSPRSVHGMYGEESNALNSSQCTQRSMLGLHESEYELTQNSRYPLHDNHTCIIVPAPAALRW